MRFVVMFVFVGFVLWICVINSKCFEDGLFSKKVFLVLY